MVELRQEILADGRRVAFSNETEFLVQVGRGKKGAYQTRYTERGDLRKALFWYMGINIGNGYKKRLYMPSCSKRPVLFRATS